MRYFDQIRILSLLSLFIILTSQGGKSQNPAADSILADTLSGRESGHSFYTMLGGGSNMIYMGSTISQDQPYGYASLVYGYNDALYVSLSAVHLNNRNPYVAFYSGSISYNHTFNSWFDLSAGISRYQVAPSLTDTLFNSFFYSDLTLGFDWKILYTKISAGSFLTDSSKFYFQVKNSRYFSTREFGRQKAFFSFDPSFNIIFGSITTAKTDEGTTVEITPPYRKRGYYNQTSSTTTYSTKNGLMEIDFGLPVSFNTSKITIEAEPSYIIQMYGDPDYPGLKGFAFFLNCYFRIF